MGKGVGRNIPKGLQIQFTRIGRMDNMFLHAFCAPAWLTKLPLALHTIFLLAWQHLEDHDVTELRDKDFRVCYDGTGREQQRIAKRRAEGD